MHKAKVSIRRKITLIIAVSIAVITFACIGLIYFTGSNFLTNFLGREYAQLARALSENTRDILEGEIEDVVSYTTRHLWINAVREKNVQYAGMDKAAIERRMLDMDKKWEAAKKGDPILKEYLDNDISQGMHETIKVRGKLAEIFITDKYGGLVASSDKTSDFYQADEEWWQKAYNGGKGAIYVGEAELDQSTNKWVISIAAPIKDDNGEFLGVCKDNVILEKLFSNLENFKLGDTGHAILTNEKGMLLFHHGITSIGKVAFSEDDMQRLFKLKRQYMVIREGHLHSQKVFMAFAWIKPPHSPNDNAKWVIFVVQDATEALAPVHEFVVQLVIIALFMTIMLVPVSYFFSGIIVAPIRKLRLAVEHVIAGDLDYKIMVKTGDEIEEFANAFENMIANIKTKQEELSNFSKGLESKVEERTRELRQAQEASLNIMEDLQLAKEELERSNKELMKLDQLKSDFISTVSHELRTPLSIIKEGISLVIDKIPGEINEKQQKILDISKLNIDRLARIIDSLLDISKIEAGKAEMKRGLINISEIVNQVAVSFEGKAKDKGLEVKLDVDDVKGSVYADADRIIQVLTNLVGNAVKFTQSGSIKISCKDKDEDVVCSVADTGAGISKEDLNNVFNKFQQFGRTAGAGEKGTGLGLSIAKNIIDMHKGDIWVDSELGKGSTFTFKLRKYTTQTLFKEYVDAGIQKAAQNNASMSIIIVRL
ncbi:MAG: ATP-binding protein, partial [Candidatus Omnitrophica bacterium]|nr:ATP-binding protein [Candidatus Omnitrophota bacterium]